MKAKRRAEAAAPARPASPSRPLLAAVLALAALAVFWNCVDAGFVFDDEQFVQKNVFLTSAKFLPRLVSEPITAGAGLNSNLFRPLQSLSHFLDVRLWGLDPWGHHLSSVLLHAAASASVFWWLSGLAAPLPAFAAAALYSLHPLQSEAVGYISGRGDTLGILFLCLGLSAFRRSAAAAFACALLALASKESLVLFPVFLFLSEKASGRPMDWRRHAPFWALAALYTGLRLGPLNFADTLNFYGRANVLSEHPAYRAATWLTTLTGGLRLWAWPSDLHHERSWPVYGSFLLPRVVGSLAFLAAWLGAAAWAWRRQAAVAASLLWFVAATATTSNLVVIINALFYDHWFLLPGLGLALLAARLPWSKGSYAAALALALLLSALTWKNNKVWHGAESLWTHILKYEPDSAKAHNNLAMALSDDGRLDESIQEYRRAIALSDTYPQTHHNLAWAYERQGRLDEASDEYRRAAAMSADFFQPRVSLGALALRAGRKDEAERAFTEALAVYPYAVNAYLGLAQLRWDAGDLAGARAVLERGLKSVDDPALHKALELVASQPKPKR